jgi:hypothetical protein
VNFFAGRGTLKLTNSAALKFDNVTFTLYLIMYIKLESEWPNKRILQ